jgi:cysteine synthase
MQTPQLNHPKLAQTLGISELYLKREDLSLYGSHKGRSIPHMIKTYFGQGIRNFVISSSGNAALAAIHTIAQHNKNNPSTTLSLKIFVGEIPICLKYKLLKLLQIHRLQTSLLRVSKTQ